MPDAHDTETLAEVLAVAQIIRPWTLCDDGGRFDHGSERAAQAILDSSWFAARIVQARAGEGALRELVLQRHQPDPDGTCGWCPRAIPHPCDHYRAALTTADPS